jgi:TolB-like protein/Tfp pilus assembly protein PilF
MAGAVNSSPLLHFDTFEVDLHSCELRNQGAKIRLQPQPFQLLALLLEHPGKMVTRKEIRQRLWSSDTFVDFEHSLNTSIKKLREALGEEAGTPRYIETLPRYGYRFIGKVERIARPSVAGPRGRRAAPVQARQFESIAVLPLENLSSDPEQEYFADGLTDALITCLGKFAGLRVISRTSVMQYKGARKPLPQIARELNVDTVVEGTVQRSGSRVRVTAQLLDARADRHLWAESYDRDLRDILVLQEEVAQAIASEIRISLAPREQTRIAHVRAVNPEAYEAYLKGRYCANQLTPVGWMKANEHFMQAMKADPTYAPAYAAFADNCVWASYGITGAQRVEVYAKGREAASRALELDDTLAEAHAALAGLKFHFGWDWAGAEKGYRRALELNPNSVAAHDAYGEFLMRMKRPDESIAEYKRAQELDPRSLAVSTRLGWSYGLKRQYEPAIRQFQKVLELDPNFTLARFSLGVAYEETGRHDEAIREIQAALATDKESGPFLTYLGYTHGMAGRREEALTVLAEFRRRAANGGVPRFYFALLYLGMHQNGEALAELEKAYEERDDWMVTLKASPELDPLRSDPRFQDLMRRMNFPP